MDHAAARDYLGITKFPTDDFLGFDGRADIGLGHGPLGFRSRLRASNKTRSICPNV